MKAKYLIWVLIVILVAISIKLSIDNNRLRNYQRNIKDSTVYDTSEIKNPVPIDSFIVRYRTVRLPVSETTRSDSKETVKIDSASVTIPIYQKEYSDSNYHAWVSGYDVKIDSIQFVNKTRTIVNTVYVKKKTHFGLGIQAGATWTDNKVTPYIGIGLSYNFLAW